MADHDEDNFEKGDSGASHTYPSQAGSLKKGGFALLKGFPCKIAEITTSKAGKHGHAKASIVGMDIFTNKKYEDCCPTSHNMEVPNVVKNEMSLIDVNPDGFMTLMGDDGSTKEDLKLPADPEVNIYIQYLA
jgi:translation initiation factor 5A